MNLKIFKKQKKELRVLFASAEVAPFSKVGGLADVVGELPVYLDKEDVECAIFTPLYGCIDQNKYNIKEIENSELKINMGHSQHIFKLKMTEIPKTKVKIFFIDNPKYFSCFNVVYPKWCD